MTLIENSNKMNSFHIRMRFRKVPFRPSWKVIKVWRKNWSKRPTRKILHSKTRSGLS